MVHLPEQKPDIGMDVIIPWKNLSHDVKCYGRNSRATQKTI